MNRKIYKPKIRDKGKKHRMRHRMKNEKNEKIN
jgi:hypothetical protein